MSGDARAAAAPRPVVVLVGPSGAGKTTVGRLIAESLGRPFADTDEEIERVSGRTVPEIFAEQGEPAFRALERTVVLRMLSGFDGVLALGGGAVLDLETRAALRDHLTVYLFAEADQAVQRISKSGLRPLLAGDPIAEFKAMMGRRREIYRQVARFQLDTTNRSPQQAAQEILSELSGWAAADRGPE